MLEIRNEQMEVFERIAVKDFEDRTVEFIKEYFPKPYEILGETRIREIIQYGIEQAEIYEFTTERNIQLYISFMFMLGSGFDTDPQYPWALQILNDEEISDEDMRMDQLYDKAMDYLYAVAGENNEHVNEAIKRLHHEHIEDLPDPISNDFEDYIAKWFNRIFPEKYEYIGEECVDLLIQFGMESAEIYDISSQQGLLVYIGLMYLFGSNFDEDLQFPWASEILNSESITDESQKYKQLYDSALSFLDQWVG